MSEPVAPEIFVVPGLGMVTREERFRSYRSKPVHVPILMRACHFILDGYAEDDRKSEFHDAIANFVHLNKAALADSEEALFRYYKDCEEWWLERGEAPLTSGHELWAYVTLGDEPRVTRRLYEDRAIYVSVECECAWEEEHGLQLVFKNGLRVNKLGSYDGHLTNSDAFADPQLEDVIYHPLT